MLAVDYALIVLSLLLFAPLNNLTRKPKTASRTLGGKGICARWVGLGGVVALPAASWLVWDREPFVSLERLRILVLLIQAILTWRFVTRDFDVTQSLAPQRRARVALLVFSPASYFYPPFLLVWIYIARNLLPDWQHHISMPSRMIQMYLTLFMGTWVLSCAGSIFSTPLNPGVTPYVIALGCVQISHYLKAGVSKINLGAHWSDWLLYNKTHHLVISAYNWGWANFVPSATAHRIAKTLAAWVVPLNMLTLCIEIIPIFAFLHVKLYVAMLCSMSLMNLMIFLLSGILFWEYILTNLALALTLVALNAENAAPVFGLEAFLVSLAVLVWPVGFKKIWHPTDLAWWDGPFIGRIRWRVQGESGKVYGLYNDFMCPYEREYGRMYGYFLVDEKIIHGHLGLLQDKTLAERIQTTKGDRKMLDDIKREHGQSWFDPALAAEHEHYLATMFRRLNRGVAKNILPPWLRCLKAPGGQFFYWGPYPRYKGQEKIRTIRISYNEMYFDETRNRTIELCDRSIAAIQV